MKPTPETCFVNLHTHIQHDDCVEVVSYEIGSGKPFPAASYVSAGIHPWDVGNADIDKAVKFLKTVNISAIGEIGLDFLRDTDRGKQSDVFKAQLEVAEVRNLPVIVHCVRAYSEAIKTLSEYRLKAVIFHGYTGSPEQTSIVINKGYYVSLGTRSLQSSKTIESIRQIPLDRLFTETDISTTSIETIYSDISAIKNIDVEELKNAVYNNFKKIFE